MPKKEQAVATPYGTNLGTRVRPQSEAGLRQNGRKGSDECAAFVV